MFLRKFPVKNWTGGHVVVEPAAFRTFLDKWENIAKTEILRLGALFGNEDKNAEKDDATINLDPDEPDPNASISIFNDFMTAAVDNNDSEHEDSDISVLELELTKFTNLNAEKDVYKFWRKNKKELPNLYNIFKYLASIPPSNGIVERFFSATGLIYNSKTNQMGTDTLESRALLYYKAKK